MELVDGKVLRKGRRDEEDEAKDKVEDKDCK
jgi:hypothetical protein